ncbi:MAG: branched-chain amino acid ABC transporter permease, partial [Pseudomonadota bacterium]
MKYVVYAAILAAGIAAPIVLPGYTTQFSVLWVMVLLALTWDLQGGQMGYNSLGNIFFFGFGMYVSAVCQIGIVY